MHKCVTLGCPGPIHEEDGWDVEIMYRFQKVEQSDYKRTSILYQGSTISLTS
jgi:hypothetical protein